MADVRVPRPTADMLAARPFTGLWFSASEEEAAFCDAYTRGRFRLMDRPFHAVDVAITLAFGVVQLRQDGLTLNGIWALAYVAIELAIDWVWVAWGADSRPRLRTAMAIAKRGSIYVFVALLVEMFFRVTVANARSFVRFMVLTTGVLDLSFHSFAVPLLARHHLALQVPTVAFMVFYTPGRACSGETIAPQGAPYFVAAWRWLHALCTGRLHGTPVPQPHECCRDLVLMSILVLGLCLPSYVLWASEYRARTEFSGGPLPPLTWATMAVHAMLFVTSVSCLWVVLHPEQ
ncbi:unnamed protein product [Ostreobium quekettii]|uniref:Uncharacterized protein n=1 Tax=Ostreobium quekettii TaxID=121088 RepID=A0A8S1IWK1_9CHLO|nr:unnamed protein product [Ostreobium quekettii]